MPTPATPAVLPLPLTPLLPAIRLLTGLELAGEGRGVVPTEVLAVDPKACFGSEPIPTSVEPDTEWTL